MDLHSPQIQGFFKKPVDHLYALLVLCEYIKSMGLDNYVIVSPDAGYAKQARRFAGAIARVYMRQSISPLFEKLPDKVIKASFMK